MYCIANLLALKEQFSLFALPGNHIINCNYRGYWPFNEALWWKNSRRRNVQYNFRVQIEYRKAFLWKEQNNNPENCIFLPHFTFYSPSTIPFHHPTVSHSNCCISDYFARIIGIPIVYYIESSLCIHSPCCQPKWAPEQQRSSTYLSSLVCQIN